MRIPEISREYPEIKWLQVWSNVLTLDYTIKISQVIYLHKQLATILWEVIKTCSSVLKPKLFHIYNFSTSAPTQRTCYIYFRTSQNSDGQLCKISGPQICKKIWRGMSVQNFVKLKPAKILNLKSSNFWRKVGGGKSLKEYCRSNLQKFWTLNLLKFWT